METCDSLSSIPRSWNDPEPWLWFPETGEKESITSSGVLGIPQGDHTGTAVPALLRS